MTFDVWIPRSDPQVAVGLLETIEAMCRMLTSMNLSDAAVQEALTQFAYNKDVDYIYSLSQIFLPLKSPLE